MLEEHLLRLAQALDLPVPRKNKLSGFEFQLSDDLVLTFTEKDPGFFIFSVVGPPPTQKKEEAFIYFMKANLLGQGTGGQVLGLDAEEKFLTLSRLIQYDMNYQHFKDLVEDFANYVLYWREEANRLQKESLEGIV